MKAKTGLRSVSKVIEKRSVIFVANKVPQVDQKANSEFIPALGFPTDVVPIKECFLHENAFSGNW